MAISNEQLLEYGSAYAGQLRSQNPAFNEFSDDEILEAVLEGNDNTFNKFVDDQEYYIKQREADEIKRTALEPNEAEWDSASLPQKAEYLRLKTGGDPAEAREFIAGMPGKAKATFFDKPTAGAEVGDMMNAWGRGAGALADLTTGGDYLESLSQPNERNQDRGFLGSLFQGTLRDPTTPLAIAAAPYVAGGTLGKMALKGAGVGAGSNLLRTGITEEELSPLGLGVETVAGGLGEVGGVVGSKIAGKAKGLLKNLTEEATGIPFTALDQVSTPKGLKKLESLAGQEYEVGKDLIEDVHKMPQKHMIEETEIIEGAANDMLPIDMGDVRIQMQEALIKPKGNAKLLPWQNKANELITQTIEAIAPDGGGPLDAKGALFLRRSIDATPDYSKIMGESGDAINDKVSEAYSRARGTIQGALIESAENSGNPQYISAMKSLSDKFDVSTKMKKNIGSSPEISEPRIEGYMSNVGSGRNKTQQRGNLARLDELLGTDYISKAETIANAKYFPPKSTSTSPISVPLGSRSVTGGTLSKMLSMTNPLSSPLMATKTTIPAMRALEKAPNMSLNNLLLRNLANQSIIGEQ